MSLLVETIDAISPLNSEIAAKAKNRLDQLTMPHWALGRLMDTAEQLAGITGTMHPKIDRRIVIVMAGDHGIVDEGISAYPQAVTVQMIYNFLNGGAGINALSNVSNSEVAIVDMGVAGEIDIQKYSDSKARFFPIKIGNGTKNFAKEPAMTREDAVRSIEAGITVINRYQDYDLFGTGDMGIGNTTPSSAIIAVMTNADVELVTGRGTGIDDASFFKKTSVIKKALAFHKPDKNDAIDVLSKIGGFEIGGIAGLILGAAALKKPVIVDGLISTAGALLAYAISPQSAAYMIAGHRSVEQGHKVALRHLGKQPLLDLDFRLGEGTGAAIAMPLIEGAVRILTEVSTFEEASVSGKS